jgi:FkbM family methyltransferase
MNSCLNRIRDRFHPLNHLRRHAFSREILRAMDIPVWRKLPGVDWKVRVRLVSHASAFLLPGGVEPAILGLFSAVAREIGIRTFWDVGANVGYYTWLTKSIAPKAEGRMFEPDADNAALIRETMHRTPLNGIVLREVAMSDTQNRMTFVRDKVSGSTGGIQETLGTFSQDQWGVVGPTITVDTVTLDQERARAGAVDLLKIDVEGHEEAVVRGGQRTIEKDQPILIFECSHGGTEITGFLSRLGYWVGDAERMSDELGGATNFLALPPRHRALRDRLREAWPPEKSRFGRARALG